MQKSYETEPIYDVKKTKFLVNKIPCTDDWLAWAP